MDKKNTMLLTVIAVATLLVAVVGATFAYFTVNSTSTTATTTVTTKAEAVGSVSLSSVNSAFYLSLTADQMSYENKDTVYYATTDNSNAVTATPGAKSVAKITATATENANATYTCTFDYNVTTTGDAAAMTVLAADSTLTLSADTGVTLNGTLFNLGTASATGTGSVTLAAGETKNINAIASFTNTDEIQDGLAGAANITTTILFDHFVCDTTTAS